MKICLFERVKYPSFSIWRNFDFKHGLLNFRHGCWISSMDCLISSMDCLIARMECLISSMDYFISGMDCLISSIDCSISSMDCFTSGMLLDFKPGLEYFETRHFQVIWCLIFRGKFQMCLKSLLFGNRSS